MDNNSTVDTPKYAWKCFPGGLPPLRMVAGWKALLELPQGSLDAFWALVENALREPGNPQNQQLVDAYTQQFSAESFQTTEAIGACELLLHQSAALNLSADGLRADLEQLSRGNLRGTDFLMARYDVVRQKLREAILEDTLADHGKVLVGLEWRVDQVNLSHRGAELDTPVMYVGLKYRDGQKMKGLSLQLTPHAFRMLSGFCTQFSEPDQPLDES